MHKEGHIGIGLFVYSPIAYYLVDQNLLTLFGLGMVGFAVWSFLPDIDMELPITHRGPTHSIAFAGLAGLLTAIAFIYLSNKGTVSAPVGGQLLGLAFHAVFGFGIGFLGVVCHIIGDVLTPTGVTPFWPLSNWWVSLDIVLAKNKKANQILSMLGAVALTFAIVLGTLGQGAIFAGIDIPGKRYINNIIRVLT